MKINWKHQIKRFFGYIKKIWEVLPSEYKKYFIGIWLIIIGNLPVWKLFSFGSYVQAGAILGGIFVMFSDKLGGLLDKKERIGPAAEKIKYGYCAKCGRRLKKKEDFCSKCGVERREI